MIFNSIHNHTTYSTLDGLSKPHELAYRAYKVGSTAVGISDHGVISAAVHFVEACKETCKCGRPKAYHPTQSCEKYEAIGIKPILGCEFYVCDQPASIKEKENKNKHHLCLFAKNLTGYKILIKLVSRANDNFYTKARISVKDLEDFDCTNFIAFSGHPGSELFNILFRDSKSVYKLTYEQCKEVLYEDYEERAIKFVENYKRIFGDGNFFIEIQTIDAERLPCARLAAEILRVVAVKTNTKPLATCDSHYPERKDAKDQRVLLATALRTTLPKIEQAIDNDDEIGLEGFFKSDNYHLGSLEDMLACNTEEEINNTVVLSDMVEVYNITSKPIFPKYVCPNNTTPDEHLRELCREGWKKKISLIIPRDKHKEYADRVKEELEVFTEAKIAPYFLVVQDYINKFKNDGVLIGPGRGSAGGCLVSYLLNIIELDPIEYGLSFARFYNRGRNTADKVSLPDIDTDFPKSMRSKVIEYLQEKYGHDCVAQIVTFGTMKGRSALKDVLTAHEACSFSEMNEITKFIPNEAEINDDLQEMTEEEGESSIIKWALENNASDLSKWCSIKEDGALEGDLAEYFAQAIRLEGCKRSMGRHASGILISPVPISDICPTVRVKDDGGELLVAGYDMIAAEKSGLVKADILGITSLDTLMEYESLLAEGDKCLI